MNAITNNIVFFSTTSATLLKDLKEAGMEKVSKKAVADLIAGKTEAIGDWILGMMPAETAPAKAADADKKPEFTAEQIVQAQADALAAGAVIQTTKPAETAPAKPATVRAKAMIKAHVPKGKIKPVRAGTKIAKGLEMLLAGTTEALLVAANLSDDTVDFINRRVTKRGYGVALTEGALTLVFPEGATAIVYAGKVEAPVVAAPAVETKEEVAAE